MFLTGRMTEASMDAVSKKTLHNVLSSDFVCLFSKLAQPTHQNIFILHLLSRRTATLRKGINDGNMPNWDSSRPFSEDASPTPNQPSPLAFRKYSFVETTCEQFLFV